MQRFLFLPFILLLMTTCSSGQGDFANLSRYQADNAARAGEAIKVVFLGNSITDGWYARDTAFFENNNFVGRGISGQTSEQLLLRFRPDVINLKPEIVVIHIGTNDVAENTRPYSEDYTVGNIASMIDIADQSDIQVVLASVLPATTFSWRKELGDRSAAIVQLNDRLKNLAKEKGVYYLDYHTALKNDQNGMDADLAPDGVHPTMKGYGIMKEMVLKALR
jgi:lysophospholipase L1-like esterase